MDSKEEEQESEELRITNELSSGLRENNEDMYKEIDQYILKNQREELEDVESCESAENNNNLITFIAGAHMNKMIWSL